MIIELFVVVLKTSSSLISGMYSTSNALLLLTYFNLPDALLRTSTPGNWIFELYVTILRILLVAVGCD